MEVTTTNTSSIKTLQDDNIEDDEESLFAELESENDYHSTNFREQRIEELKKESHRIQEMKASNHGTYEEILSDKEILEITTSTKFCILHFFHKEFRRCQIMDHHLSILAPKYFKTRFIKVDVKNAPFLVDRLKIQILPCVICFVDSIAIDRLIGFDELKSSDSFQTSVLENRLAKSNVITLKDSSFSSKRQRKTIFGFSDKTNTDDDNTDDED